MDDINTTIRNVIAAKEGDKLALDEICKRYMGRIHKMARQRLGPQLRYRLDSLDISQEVIIRIILGIDKFEFQNNASFLNWVSKLVENTIRDQADHEYAAKRDIRKEAINKSDETKEDRLLEMIAIDPRISQQLQLKEDVLRLEKALDNLDSDDREIVLLRNYADMPFKEIGTELNCKPDAARMKYVRAIDRLTDLMSE